LDHGLKQRFLAGKVVEKPTLAETGLFGHGVQRQPSRPDLTHQLRSRVENFLTGTLSALKRPAEDPFAISAPLLPASRREHDFAAENLGAVLSLNRGQAFGREYAGMYSR
jgi:hypothetical protein